MDPRRRLGNKGEIIAARFLEKEGYKILAHQFKARAGEIDLVVEKNGELVFVEVKTRKNLRFGYPEDSVNRNKICRMVMAGQSYLEKLGLNDRPFRLDVIAVIFGSNQAYEIKHLEGVDTGGLE